MAELTYTRVGDYYIPNLLLDPEPEAEKFYGKYGDLRREYIREHRTALWASLVNSGRLDDHLTTIRNFPDLAVDLVKHPVQVAHNAVPEDALDPVCDYVEDVQHWLRPLSRTGSPAGG